MTAAEEQDIRIARFLAGEAGPEEAMQLADWAAENAERGAELEEAKRVFALDLAPDPARTWQQIERAIKPRPLRRMLWPFAAAAVILLVLCFGWWLNQSRPVQPSPVVYTSGPASKKIDLPDGSTAQLMAGSRLTLIGQGRYRFSGSAEFTIRHQAKDPVRIDMEQLSIKDLGTRFSVNTSADQDTICIAVQEGKVLLNASQRASLILKAGEKALYTRSARRLERYAPPTVASKQIQAVPIKATPAKRSRKDSDTIIKPIAPVPAKTTIIKPVKPDTNRIKPIH
ncbi:FecR domain-containing protein [Mucilaginibacter sp. CAU 1740]|uniref:FecR domain-containing protein n=1 Tax=Mucilaginibacter sp. CAU 1740 TaxID=3140365 RepID=UPI00325AD4FE